MAQQEQDHEPGQGSGENSNRVDEIYRTVKDFIFPPETQIDSILRLTNEHRRQHKMPDLMRNDKLNESAQQHAAEMAGTASSGTFSHFSHEGAMARFERTGLQCINCAENLARVHGHEDIPAAVVNGWIDSPGHRRNLVGPFNVCGIGCSTNKDGVTFVSQLFALVIEGASAIPCPNVLQNPHSHTIAVATAAGLIVGGAPGALVAAAGASALELGAGFRLVTAPQVIKRHIVRQLPAQLWRHSCQRCGAFADELHAGRDLLCSDCVNIAGESSSSPPQPSDKDNPVVSCETSNSNATGTLERWTFINQ